MKRFAGIVLVGAIAVTLNSRAFAGVNDTFSYPDGPLTTSSGGVWQLWDPVGPPPTGDAVVSSGRATINSTTDVVRQFPNELQTVGNMVTFSFDFMVAQANTGADYTVFFSPASTPYSTGQNYGNSIGFTFDWNTGAGGNSNVGVWPGGGAITQLTTVTPGVFHTLSGTLTKNASTLSYAFQVDGGPMFTGSSAHTDARGINAFEMYDQTGVGDNGFQIDNLNMTAVPEPGTLSLLVLGAFAALRRRQS